MRPYPALLLSMFLAASFPAWGQTPDHLDLTVPRRMINDRTLTLKAELRDSLDRMVWGGCSRLGTVSVTRVSDGASVPITVTVFDNHIAVPDDSIRFYNGVGSVSFTLDEGAAAAAGDIEVTVTLGSVSASKMVTVLASPTFRTMAGSLTGTKLVWGPDETIRVTGDLTIGVDRTLVIHPGTLVMVDTTGALENGTIIRVNGRIQALGTADNPIYFFSERGPDAMILTQSGSASNADAWQGIHHSGPERSRYEHVILTGAGNGTVIGHPRPPVLRFNGTHGFDIRHCTFVDNPGMVIATPGTGSFTLRDSLVSRAGIGAEFNGNGHRLAIADTWWTSSGRAPEPAELDGDHLHVDGPWSVQTIRRCVFNDGGDEGIDHSGSHFLAEDILITDVRDKGIAMTDGSADVRNCLIFKTAGGTRGAASVEHCTIATPEPMTTGQVAAHQSVIWPNSLDTCSADVDWTIVGNVNDLGCGTGNQRVNPQYESTANCDYNPKPGSPALTAGPDGGRIGWLGFPHPTACGNNADCDDGIDCSSDACSLGVCVSTPIAGCAPCGLPDEAEGPVVNGKSPTSLTWTDQGPGVLYDAASGSLSELRADGAVLDVECLENDTAATTAMDGRANPPSGDGYYYLVRAQNACGRGSWGYDSTFRERRPAGCP